MNRHAVQGLIASLAVCAVCTLCMAQETDCQRIAGGTRNGPGCCDTPPPVYCDHFQYAFSAICFGTCTGLEECLPLNYENVVTFWYQECDGDCVPADDCVLDQTSAVIIFGDVPLLCHCYF